jgi:putative protease
MSNARRGSNGTNPLPEILAPAGGPASWAAAVKAGADAVYVGLERFSARTYAENFTLPELKGVIDESRRLGVRVYLAFNSQIKDGELAEAFKMLCAAADMEPDGFIIQDLGLAALARQHCPSIPRHASTLTAVHNLDGLAVLDSLEFSRAVLSRELTLPEIAHLSQKSPLDVEIFIHGALCFSFSGLCLMSSFLGGRSALRGGCTQPCRRMYQNAGRQKTFFSPSDFMGLPFIPQLKKLPITSLKIEGRMKGPDYVGAVVRAYRLALDADEEHFDEVCRQMVEELQAIPGRTNGPGYMAGTPMAPALWDGHNASGLKLGQASPAGAGLVSLTLAAPMRLLDRVRLAAGPGEEGQAYKIRQMWLDGATVEAAEAGAVVTLALGGEDGPPLSGQLYKIGSGSLEKELLASMEVKRLKAAAKDFKPDFRNVPAKVFGPRGSAAPAAAKNHPLWLWLDGPNNLQDMLKFRPRKIILPLTTENAKELHRQRKMLSSFSDFVWSLPPLLLGRSQEKIRKEAGKLLEMGHRDFMVSNIGQIALLSRLNSSLKLWGDHRLGVLNHLAGESLHDLGLAGVTLSLECDQDTYQKLAQSSFSGGVLMYLYGRPALFTARYRPPSLKRGPIISQRGEKYWTAEDGEAFILQSEHRVFMGSLLRASKPKGFVGFIVDLRREPNPLEAARRLRKAIDQGRGSPGLAFNYKRGLK